MPEGRQHIHVDCSTGEITSLTESEHSEWAAKEHARQQDDAREGVTNGNP